RHVPASILLVALALMLVGLARPRASWSVPEEDATVVLAIDTSRSMAAKDVQPTRLDAARRAADAFLDELPDKYRVGVVAFGTETGVVDVTRPGGLVEHIQVPPDPSALRQIAATTGGRFFSAPSAAALKQVYTELGRRLGHTTQKKEVTVAFAAGAVVLLL